MSSTRKGILLAFVAAVLWGVLAVALKVACRYLDSRSIVWLRFFIAFAMIALFSPFSSKNRGLLSVFKRAPKKAWFASLGLAGNYWGYMNGVELISPSNAQVFIQLGPLLLVFSGIFLFSESLNLWQLFGLFSVLVGFFLFSDDQSSSSIEGSTQYYEGVAWLVFASVSWVVFAVLQKKLVKKGWTPHRLNFFIFGSSALLFLPLADFSRMSAIPLDMWPLMLFLGLNTWIAYGALGESLSLIPVSVTSVIITINPIFTLLIMSGLSVAEVTWIDYEKIHTEGWFGALLIILGACLVAGMAKRGSSLRDNNSAELQASS